MPRYAFKVEYQGAPFAGWQRQKDQPSVQGAIEHALAKLEPGPHTIAAAGRTDAGVHALGQVAHCDLTRDWDPFRLSEALNYHLKPAPVAIVACVQVADDWHARFSALERQYLFRIMTRRAPVTHEDGQVWHVKTDLDVTAMQAAADRLIGRHDFTTFRSTICQACVSFAKGEFRKVNLRLASSHHIGKDKEGWNIGSRVLSIMLAIEREKFDLADTLIVNLRQFIREGVEGTDLRFRDTLILSILLELRKKSYDFPEVFELKEDVISKLAEDNYETGWILQTPEMICFHTWFIDKVNERSYQPNYSKEYIYAPSIAAK